MCQSRRIWEKYVFVAPIDTEFNLAGGQPDDGFMMVVQDIRGFFFIFSFLQFFSSGEIEGQMLTNRRNAGEKV